MKKYLEVIIRKLTWKHYLIYFTWKNEKEEKSGSGNMVIYGPRFTHITYDSYKDRCRMHICIEGVMNLKEVSILIRDVIKL